MQGLPSSVESGVLAWHCPVALHASAPLQTSPSGQDVPALTGVWLTPEEASQVSVVQGLPSSALAGAPAVQAPLPSQVSEPLQTLPSVQLVPAATNACLTPVVGSHASAVQGFWSSVATAVPGVQLPLRHVSADVHTSPSEQWSPSGFAGFEQAPLVWLQVPASWH